MTPDCICIKLRISEESATILTRYSSEIRMKSLSWSIILLGCLLHPGLLKQVKYNGETSCNLRILQGITSKMMSPLQQAGDQVLKITPQSAQQALYLRDLTAKWKLDLWKPDSADEIFVKKEIHVRVPSTYVDEMKGNLVQQSIPFRIMIEDMQKLIDNNAAVGRSRARAISLETYDYTLYHPMDEIYDWMEKIKDQHSNLVTHHLLANTYEERPIYYLKIGFPSNKPKKAIFMDCGIHAREWIAVAYCQWFVKDILDRYQNDQLLNKLLKQIDFYIVPVLNVDGYIYSWTTDRLWRKNRTPFNNGTCFGVDLNRNFDVFWCTAGASPDCDVITYCGPSVASELETQGVVNVVDKIKSETLMYLSIHSYGQLILLPYGYKYFPSPNHYEMTKVAEAAAAKMREPHDSNYIVGSTAVVLYFTTGSSADWAADLDIKFSYTYELRDEGDYGFELPADQIKPTCEETLISMWSIFEYINEKYLDPLEEPPPDDGAIAITSFWLNMLLSFVVCLYCALIH